VKLALLLALAGGLAVACSTTSREAGWAEVERELIRDHRAFDPGAPVPEFHQVGPLRTDGPCVAVANEAVTPDRPDRSDGWEHGR
jgi:hypothetical protein